MIVIYRLEISAQTVVEVGAGTLILITQLQVALVFLQQATLQKYRVAVPLAVVDLVLAEAVRVAEGILPAVVVVVAVAVVVEAAAIKDDLSLRFSNVSLVEDI